MTELLKPLVRMRQREHIYFLLKTPMKVQDIEMLQQCLPQAYVLDGVNAPVEGLTFDTLTVKAVKGVRIDNRNPLLYYNPGDLVSIQIQVAVLLHLTEHPQLSPGQYLHFIEGVIAEYVEGCTFWLKGEILKEGKISKNEISQIQSVCPSVRGRKIRQQKKVQMWLPLVLVLVERKSYKAEDVLQRIKEQLCGCLRAVLKEGKPTREIKMIGDGFFINSLAGQGELQRVSEALRGSASVSGSKREGSVGTMVLLLLGLGLLWLWLR